MINRPIQEKRQVPRLNTRYFVRCRLYSPHESKLDINEFEAVTCDLSEAGAALITEKSLPIGASVLIKFSVNNEIGNTLSSRRRIVVFVGTMVYCQKVGEQRYRLGVFFGIPGPENEDKFFDIMCSAARACYFRSPGRLVTGRSGI